MNFPDINSERLTLRQLLDGDSLMIQSLRSDPVANSFIARPAEISIHEAIAFIQKIKTRMEDGEIIFWAIDLKEINKMIGTICLWNFQQIIKLRK